MALPARANLRTCIWSISGHSWLGFFCLACFWGSSTWLIVSAFHFYWQKGFHDVDMVCCAYSLFSWWTFGFASTLWWWIILEWFFMVFLRQAFISLECNLGMKLLDHIVTLWLKIWTSARMFHKASPTVFYTSLQCVHPWYI